jgi:hypothetical protein
MRAVYISALTPGQIKYCLNMASMYPGCWRAMVLSAARRGLGPHPTAVALINRITFQGLMSLSVPDLREALATKSPHNEGVPHG